MAVAADGTILAGTDGGGIYLIGDAGIRNINTPEGLSSGIVMRIKHDPTRNVYWVVTSNSIAYLDADYHVTTVRAFPYSNNFDLYENSTGDLWVLSSNGIYVAAADDLIENGNFDFSHYGIANGLPHIATSNSYSCLTPEGDLYIAGSWNGWSASEGNIMTKAEDKYTFENVLLVSDKSLKVGTPYVKGAKVEAKVVKNGLGKKLRIYKYKAKHNSARRTIGHRQPYTPHQLHQPSGRLIPLSHAAQGLHGPREHNHIGQHHQAEAPL